jgi:SAM-dependent methyltransferase
MKRTDEEKNYWNVAALDPDVDNKYISDQNTKNCLDAIGDMEPRVLEVGCGVGRLMKQDYFGIDISERMLAIAKQRHPECNFMLSDGRTIPFEDKYFQTVYSVLVFQHIPFDGFVQYVKEISRVLKDDGVFIFQYIEGTEAEQFSHHYDTKKVKETLNDAGFTVISEKKGEVHKQWNWVRAEKADFEASGEVDLKKKVNKND